MQENMSNILNQQLFHKKADPVFAISCFLNNGFTSLEIIKSLASYNNSVKSNIDEIIKCQLQFYDIIECFNKQDYIEFVKLLNDYIINYADHISLQYIIILAEKAVVTILTILAGISQVHPSYFLPIEMKMHTYKIGFKQNPSYEMKQSIWRFSKDNNFEIMMKIYEVLWKKTTQFIDEDKQFKNVNSKKTESYAIGLLEHSLTVWISIFINAPLELDSAANKLIETIKEMEKYCLKKKIKYSILSHIKFRSIFFTYVSNFDLIKQYRDDILKYRPYPAVFKQNDKHIQPIFPVYVEAF